MDDKKLRKVSKKELLEILLEQAKRIEELEDKLNKTQAKLDSKKIAVTESGNLAEAALKLNGIFESAEATAEQYLLNVKDKCKKIEIDTKKKCQLEMENMIKETEVLCQQKKKEADDYFSEIKQKAKELTKTKESVKIKATNANKTTTSKTKNSSTKKKDSQKSKKVNTKTNSTPTEVKNIKDEKTIVEDKVVIEKSKKSIKGRPIKTIKKGKLVHE